MRGLLIANPKATSTDGLIRDVMVSALRSVLELEVVTTTHRGHAGELARRATTDGTEILVTLGGDGTIHEVVNGMLDGPGTHQPVLATIPGGSANVFARACGLSNDPVVATGAILAAVRQARFRSVGLGRANGRWFTCNAGLGLDAEVIEAMERLRAAGKAATPTRYVATAVREYFGATERRTAALTILFEDGPGVDHVFLAIVQNCSPWTFMGSVPVNACPDASFDTGLDVFAARDLRVIPSLRVTGRILRGGKAQTTTKSMFATHDRSHFTIVSGTDIALQVDGEALGRQRHVVFESIPSALSIVDTGTDL